jgi:hypothetical protein
MEKYGPILVASLRTSLASSGTAKICWKRQIMYNYYCGHSKGRVETTWDFSHTSNKKYCGETRTKKTYNWDLVKSCKKCSRGKKPKRKQQHSEWRKGPGGAELYSC